MSGNTMKNIISTLSRGALYCILIGIPYPLRALILWKFWKWFIFSQGGPYLTYVYSLAVVLISALILVNVHKNQGEPISSAKDRENAINNVFFISMETVLRTGLIFVGGCVLHYIFQPK